MKNKARTCLAAVWAFVIGGCTAILCDTRYMCSILIILLAGAGASFIGLDRARGAESQR